MKSLPDVCTHLKNYVICIHTENEWTHFKQGDRHLIPCKGLWQNFANGHIFNFSSMLQQGLHLILRVICSKMSPKNIDKFSLFASDLAKCTPKKPFAKSILHRTDCYSRNGAWFWFPFWEEVFLPKKLSSYIPFNCLSYIGRQNSANQVKPCRLGWSFQRVG